MSFGNGAGTGIGHSQPYKGDAFSAAGLGFAKIANIIIRHPFVVLRRQCQVHDHAVQKHLSPITLLPVIGKMAYKNGLLSLWKGAIDNGVLWAFSRLTELLIAELFALPKSFVPDGSSERFWRHVWLKASNFFVCTPMIVFSFIETVRSGASLTDDIQILKVIYHGYERLKQDLFGGTATTIMDRRRHSLLLLAFPTSLYHTLHFLICRWVYARIFAWMRIHVSRKLPSERKRYHTIMPELVSTMTSIFVADLLCYPLETVLHRLYIQGTRTLIDNLDTAVDAFIPAGRYTGFFDCFSSIIRKEGFMALYSGAGAIFLHYALQHCIASFVYWALDRDGRGYTSGPLKIKTKREFFQIEQDSALSANFNDQQNSPKNVYEFGSASTTSAQTFASIFPTDPLPQSSFPTFSETQLHNYNQQHFENPFLAALHENKSASTFGPLDNSHTNITTNSPLRSDRE